MFEVGGFHDAQPEQPEEAHEGEVVPVRRLLGDVQHRLELKMAQPECWREGGDWWASNVLGGGVLEHPVSHAGSVEARHGR